MKNLRNLLILFLLLITIVSKAQVYQVPWYVQNIDPDKVTVYSNDLGGGYQQVADSAAKADLPSDKRALGMMVSYVKNAQWITERYQGTDVLTVNWINEANWIGVLFTGDQWYDVTNGIAYDNNVTVGDTLKLNGRKRQTFIDLNYINGVNDTLNSVIATIKTDNLATGNQRYGNFYKYYIDNNSGINANKLIFRSLGNYITSNNDSVNNLYGIDNSIVLEKGSYQVANVLTNSALYQSQITDSIFVAGGKVFHGILNLKALDSGSQLYAEDVWNVRLLTNIGDDGKTEVDNIINIENNLSLSSKTGATTRITNLDMNKVHLYDGTIGGTFNIDNIKGLYLYNEDNRQGDNSTYGIYEAFGNNYLASKTVIDNNLTVGDTLKLNSRIRQDLILTIPATDNDTINSFTASIFADENTSVKQHYGNFRSTTIEENGGINANKFVFRDNFSKLLNKNDSINQMYGTDFILQNERGSVQIMQNNYTSLITPSGTDSAYIRFNRGIFAVNSIKALDATSRAYVNTTNTFKSQVSVGDDGNTNIDFLHPIYNFIQLNSKASGTTQVGELIMNNIHLDDGQVGGIFDIDGITGIKLYNEDNRQGDNSTYGIYEDFGDNLFTNKITTLDTLETPVFVLSDSSAIAIASDNDTLATMPAVRELIAESGGGSTSGIMQVSKAEILYTNTSQTTIITLPLNAVVWSIGFEVTTIFDDSGTNVIEIGITGTSNFFSNPSPLAVSFLYSSDSQDDWGVNNLPYRSPANDITFKYVGQNADATQGTAYIYIHYTEF